MTKLRNGQWTGNDSNEHGLRLRFKLAPANLAVAPLRHDLIVAQRPRKRVRTFKRTAR
jgi:hypothetical protein